MEFVRLDRDGGEVGVTYDHALGVGVGVELGAHLQAAARPGARDELHDHLMADQGPIAPVHGDEREQGMLDLVPLARAGREVRHPDAQTGFLGQAAQLELPQPNAVAIAAPAIGHDRQLGGLGIALAPHDQPPAPDGLNRKRRRVVVGAHADPARVGADVVHAVGIGTTELGVDEVVDLDAFGLTLGMPLMPCVPARVSVLVASFTLPMTG